MAAAAAIGYAQTQYHEKKKHLSRLTCILTLNTVHHTKLFQKVLTAVRTNLEKNVSDFRHRPPTPSRPKPNQKQVEIITTFGHRVEDAMHKRR